MPVSSSNLATELRQAASELGFAACGFTDAGPLQIGNRLGDWLAADRHASMSWMAREPERRLNPVRALPGAKSVVMAAWPYPLADLSATPPASALRGRVAAYAVGPDYHHVVAEKLSSLADTIQALTGAGSVVYVDGGPLLEKEFAARAGIGWFGHHTNLLTRNQGSAFLLGALVTEADISPDAPFQADHCGTCRACPSACPTGALDHGPTIDANLCISYLTIEHRGPIARDLRAAMGPWVFGCDWCQEVCPWNPEELSVDERLWPYLPALLELSREQFRERFAGTAILRAKRRGLARNASIALGNSGSSEAIEPLIRALLQHDEALVRAHAAWALGALAPGAAGPTASEYQQIVTGLTRGLRQERAWPVRIELETALKILDPKARR